MKDVAARTGLRRSAAVLHSSSLTEEDRRWRKRVVVARRCRRWAGVNGPMLLALAVLWSGSFFFNGVAVRELPSFTLVWLRVAVAAAVLLLLMRLLGQRMPAAGRVWANFFGMGLLNNVVPFALIVWGQHHIASGLASILNATTPLFTVLVAHLLTPDERLTPLKAAGVIVGFAGAVAMIGPDALNDLGTGVLAQLACLAGALSHAFAGIFGRRFKRMGVTAIATAAGQVCASTMLLLPVMLLVDRPLDAGGARSRHLGSGAGAGPALHGARIRALFPHLGRGGCHQPAASHLSGSDQRHPARGVGAGRSATSPSPARHGLDRAGGWPALTGVYRGGSCGGAMWKL